MSTQLKALTLWRPWAWAIIAGHKDIENRGWAPTYHIGQWIAIHAGRTYDMDSVDTICSKIGIAKIPSAGHDQGIVGVAQLVDVVQEHSSTWFVGPHGLLLANVTKFRRPIEVRGQQGLWDPDGPTLKACREAYEEATGISD